MLIRELTPTSIRDGRPVVWMLPVLLLACACGCTPRDTDQPAAAPGVSRTASSGPVTLTLTVAHDDLDFSENAEVVLEVQTEPDVKIDLHDYSRAIREGEHHFEMSAVAFDEAPLTLRDDGKLVSTRRYRLEFYLPGQYELPPASLTYVDRRTDVSGDAAEELYESTFKELETESITITARDGAAPQLSEQELQDIETLAPIELPTVWSQWWWIVPVGSAVIVLAAVLLIPRLRRFIVRCLRGDGRRRVIVIPAHEWARRQFAALIAENLVGRGLFKEWHYRISSIVRGYIERRYGVSAGEMTTEEFLETAVADSRFGPETTHELKGFMHALDLVKYARHEPTLTESDGALRAAADFVERTRDRGGTETAERADTPNAEERAA